MSTQTFKGHGIEAMFINVILALSTFSFLLLVRIRPIEEVTFYHWPLLIVTLFYLPFPAYLFFELKHLILKDGIAEDKSLISFLVFGAQSLLGLVFQIISLVIFLNLGILGEPTFSKIVFVSFISSLGACLGLTDLHILYIFIPTKVFRHCLIFLKSWRLILVCVSTTILLSFLTSFFISL